MLLGVTLAAPAVALGGQKVVRLDVEGRVRPVLTYASSAPDLLERAGLRVERRDGLRPKGPLRHGATVELRRGKPLNLLLDGEPRTVWVHGLTVGEALGELGMTPDADDFVAPAPQEAVRPGMEVTLRNAIHVTVHVDGKTRDVVSSAPTVRDLLTQAGVRLGPADRVSPALDSAPVADGRVRVTRIRTIVQEKRVGMPFSHREVKDPKLEKGLERVGQKGAEGVKLRRYQVVLQNGKAISRKLLDERVLRKPRDEVVRIGTAVPSFKGGGNAQEGLASWYRFDGLGAAHRSIPIGTVVRVTNLANGRSINVVIRDRGPFVDGRVIDLSQAAFREIAPLGSGTARVKIEW